ncbi:hypothetical protein VNI00_016279 [Paramarasmius palmivorus]|uniref:BTB domain-containing protein n=1 Tax=Paramarasmius palmivorus TaxID=297713 RepID=A0AAW0BDS2_9AGAR
MANPQVSNQSTTPSYQPRLPIAVTEPFTDPNADIIFRTSDNADFHVHKCILSLVSPFFADMFSLPQPPTDKPSKGGKSDSAEAPSASSDRVIQVDENSLVLDRVLRYIYPSCDPQPWINVADIVPVLRIMLKYQMEHSKPFTRIIESLLSRPLELDESGVSSQTPSVTMGVLSVLYFFKDSLSREWLERAAKLVLRIPLKTLIGPLQCSQLEYLSARAYLDLLEYHKKCSEVIKSRSLPAWSDASDLVYECTNGAMTDGSRVPASAMLNSDAPRNSLTYLRGWYKEHPYTCAEWSSMAVLVTQGYCQGCSVCGKNPCPNRLKAIFRLVKAEVDAAISTVPVPL